ncbi:hypothetical protein [Rathayibacter sp. VKM Ac-2927]|uniref:hypothetical protein n=1 Tax=Rathayibacter sp. VKM Ac-2927 TaxID=2929478 RepID=UPI001FB42563|nr:hypothetical protein [Rathayibacter sp. VKM Ac-2927]MCJ1689124.1 hypothetical protein [Rathayibacter sp. VKM Ac-2927]
MVRRGTVASALDRVRRGGVRPTRSVAAVRRRDSPGRLLGATAASAAAIAVLALALAALAPLAGLPSAAGGTTGPCDEPRELLAASSVVDREGEALAGHLLACVDADHRSLTIHNDTPVAWVLSDPGVRGVVGQSDPRRDAGVTGLLSAYSARIGRGLVLPPGASAAISAGPGRLAPRPDEEATRLFLALTAIVGAQDQVRATEPARAPRSVVRTAALTCALALVRDGAAPGAASITRAAGEPACSDAWQRAQAKALDDRWTLPGLAEALALPGRPEADAALARSAADWFAASAGFSWGGVDRPERLD